ncbi:hypothetical protein OUZ56_032448 [Daphnia magna]|uniref:Uncharacterized protein n=1 Tax=Daphnia magna TaxID=35525 RepID=A0ABR0B8X9_9CRUS|nr:hypothetical protein OUZ56_032448 [Daphnia magna]
MMQKYAFLHEKRRKNLPSSRSRYPRSSRKSASTVSWGEAFRSSSRVARRTREKQTAARSATSPSPASAAARPSSANAIARFLRLLRPAVVQIGGVACATESSATGDRGPMKAEGKRIGCRDPEFFRAADDEDLRAPFVGAERGSRQDERSDLIDRNILGFWRPPADLGGLIQASLENDEVGMDRALFAGAEQRAGARAARAARFGRRNYRRRFGPEQATRPLDGRPASLAKQGLGEAERRHFLPDAVRSVENVCVMHLIGSKRATQSGHGRFLAEKRIEEAGHGASC